MFASIDSDSRLSWISPPGHPVRHLPFEAQHPGVEGPRGAEVHRQPGLLTGQIPRLAVEQRLDGRPDVVAPLHGQSDDIEPGHEFGRLDRGQPHRDHRPERVPDEKDR